MEEASHGGLLAESQAGSGELGAKSGFNISEWCELGVPQQLEILWHTHSAGEECHRTDTPECQSTKPFLSSHTVSPHHSGAFKSIGAEYLTTLESLI